MENDNIIEQAIKRTRMDYKHGIVYGQEYLLGWNAALDHLEFVLERIRDESSSN